MTRYKDRFHQAARDGYLDLLREATKSESDSPDENGMTPVMWAAFYGNLDALRLLISRGGSPDKADLMGSTSLHFAALNGHMHCVSFLVNFGANIWTLDNDLHTALDLASLREHGEIVDFLDGIATRQFTMNRRVVKRMREKAAIDAQKRIKKYDKLMRKAEKKAEKAAERRQDSSSSVTTTSLNSRSATTNPNYRHDAAAAAAAAAAGNQQHQHLQLRHQHRGNGASPRAFSEHFATSSRSSRTNVGIAKRLVGQQHQRRRRRQNFDDDDKSQDVVYARSDSRSLVSGPVSEPDFATAAGAAAEYSSDSADSPGLFERPGFGSVAFFHSNPMTRTLQSLKDRQDDRDGQEGAGGSPQRLASYTDSIGTSGSLLRRWRDLPWSEEEVENLDDDQDDQATLSPHTELELFLTCLGVTEFMPVFTSEQIDLDALGLCHDKDLQDLGLPLGPRKKILEALQRRKDALAATRSMQDLRL